LTAAAPLVLPTCGWLFDEPLSIITNITQGPYITEPGTPVTEMWESLHGHIDKKDHMVRRVQLVGSTLDWGRMMTRRPACCTSTRVYAAFRLSYTLLCSIPIRTPTPSSNRIEA